MRPCYRLLFLLLVTRLPGYGQIHINNVTQPLSLQSAFTKQHTSWIWQDRFFASRQKTGAFSWQVNENFNSRIILPGSAVSQWKDDQTLNALFYFNSSRYQLGWYINSWLQADKHTDKLKTFYNHAGGIFTRFDISHNLSLTPYAGYQFSRNISQRDAGWDVGLDGKLSGLMSGAYRSALDFSSNYDFYDTRKNYNNNFRAAVTSRFSAFAGDSMHVSYMESIKQFYDNSGSALIDVSLYNREFSNMLYYAVAPRATLQLQTQIVSKNVSYFNKRNNFLIGNRISYNYTGNRLHYNFNFRTTDETLDTDGTRTDSRTRQSAFGFNSAYLFNPSDNLHLNLSYIKLQYDTPDSVSNNDDRDEQTFVLSMDYFHRFSPLLSMHIKTYGYLFHQLYIFREQSINNHWNRIIKLEPSVQYRGKTINNHFATSVIANYTDYDFDKLSLQTRSFLFRKYTLSDSISYNFTDRSAVSVRGRLEIEEKGNFFKSRFAQNRIQTYQTAYLTAYLSQRFLKRFIAQIGYAHFKRSEWRFVPIRRKTRELSNNGPFIRIVYNAPGRLTLNGSANLNTLIDSRTTRQLFTTGSIYLNYSL